ncbi:hypothetical protein HYW42_04395 [Candidatus Daviesbacteria bacterium]|nr:hypothetical protein [Candidatus Daviesbacteria bacterium]
MTEDNTRKILYFTAVIILLAALVVGLSLLYKQNSNFLRSFLPKPTPPINDNILIKQILEDPQVERVSVTFEINGQLVNSIKSSNRLLWTVKTNTTQYDIEVPLNTPLIHPDQMKTASPSAEPKFTVSSFTNGSNIKIITTYDKETNSFIARMVTVLK